MKIIQEIKLDFDDVLIKPKRSNLFSRSDVNLLRKFTFPHSSRFLSCVPIFAANMDTTGSMAMSATLSKYDCLTCLHKHYSSQDLINYFSTSNKQQPTFYSTGISKNDIEKLKSVFDRLEVKPNLCIDVANGYSESFVKAVSKIREWYPDIIIMAGNVVTPEMTEELIMHGGVDIVKVGIGPGSVCTTRLKTGIGYPQLSAIMECSDVAHSLGGHICGDGGCKVPADICKAFGANADFIMLGGMLAGTDCCEGDWQYEYLCKSIDQKGNLIREWWQTNDPQYNTEKRKKSLKFYGMSSKEAMDKHNGGVADYRTSEGKCVSIEYKGKTEEIIKDILGGIRSCCTYVGAKSIKDLPKHTTFIRVNNTHNKVYEK
jgi:GMP reductase